MTAIDSLLEKLTFLAEWLGDPDRHLEITLSDDQWEVTVYVRDVSHPEVEQVTHNMGTFGVIHAESKELDLAIETATEICSRVVRAGINNAVATRVALGPTLMANPLIDTSGQHDRVLDALVRGHDVLKLANDGDEPGERCVYDLGVWLAATDRLVQRIDELGGVTSPLRDVLRDLLHQTSPRLVCGVSSVGEPPAAGDASSDPAAGEGARS
ncbi:hypothetical protein G6031_09450 [Dietzia sp. CQ4]|uniref:hypothetical protein n=1 Tax=Dietzia sp. (strain CQ4) TaxID=370437 RepID=UPI0015FB6288|nr:hypothetical protein [Dietzia sp. CQ4]MBB1034612.1 hypothetical protein [Dietzia sp. CQ4]